MNNHLKIVNNSLIHNLMYFKIIKNLFTNVNISLIAKNKSLNKVKNNLNNLMIIKQILIKKDKIFKLDFMDYNKNQKN